MLWQLLLALLSVSLLASDAGPHASASRARKYSLLSYPLARCLNGTPGVYYFAPGFSDGTRKFLIHEEGGGSCKFGDIRKAPAGGDPWERGNSCRHRANQEGGYGGSDDDPSTLDYCAAPGLCQAGFDRSRRNNPLLYSWNHILVRYCDGGYFSGNHSDASLGLHFRGAEILSSALFDLKRKHGLGDATDIVLSGCSAGAIAIFAHVDWVAQHPAIPKSARFSAFPIEGYYLDDSDWKTGRHTGHRIEGMGVFTYLKKANYETQRPRAVLNKDCLAHHKHEPHLCLIASIAAPFIRSELFFWQSKHDQDILAWQPNYGAYERPEGLCLMPGGDSGNTSDIDVACANYIGEKITHQIKRLWDKSPNIGGFLDACYHHCPRVPDGIRIDDTTPLQAFAQWYKGSRRTWNEEGTWQQLQRCSSPRHPKPVILYS